MEGKTSTPFPTQARITSSTGVSPSKASYTQPSSSRLSIPYPLVALPCGSRSTSRTSLSIAPSAAARFTAVVDFPTPPF